MTTKREWEPRDLSPGLQGRVRRALRFLKPGDLSPGFVAFGTGGRAIPTLIRIPPIALPRSVCPAWNGMRHMPWLLRSRPVHASIRSVRSAKKSRRQAFLMSVTRPYRDDFS